MPEQKPNFYQLYQLVGGLDKKLDQAIKTLDDHHSRINTLEKNQDQITGKMSIIGAITGFVGGIIVMIFGNFIKK